MGMPETKGGKNVKRAGWTLGASAAISWGAFIAADTLNLHFHILLATLGIALVFSGLTLQSALFRLHEQSNDRVRESVDSTNQSIDLLAQSIETMSDAYKELAKAVATLMVDPKTPGDGPALRAVPGTGHGWHASK